MFLKLFLLENVAIARDLLFGRKQLCDGEVAMGSAIIVFV